MAMGPRLEFRQTQSLVMTPQLRQAIKLLQFTNLEVAAFVEEELERNPLLERDERSDASPELPAPDQRGTGEAGLDAAGLLRMEKLPDAVEADTSNLFDEGGASDGFMGLRGNGGRDLPDDRGIDDVAEMPRNLRAHLGEQLRLSFRDPKDRIIGAQLIALLDPAGRVPVSNAELASALGIDEALVHHVRRTMMRFDPPGLFAVDLRECLAAQLEDRNRLDPAMEALLDNLELLAKRDLRTLMQVCGVDAEDLADMIAEIRTLDPKPGAGFEDGPLLQVIPDVLMRALPNGEWLLELNPDTMPRVLVNEAYHARVSARAGREARTFLGENLSNANWLVKSLQQRANTILKVAAEIVRQQDGFFRLGVGHLRPLILRDVATAVEMHESTVSRVTANKYISTPRGVFELKYFFTTAIQAVHGGESHSAEAVRHRIRALVGAEDPEDVLSDDAIVSALRREGVDIARRTVAKYREALRIPSSVQRKREKSQARLGALDRVGS
ncbi:MAG TPA: RNA polymerase factor sigma-54 [Acetobacteraceae bacterium]|nr:RNA polymerase factor sigma-54 [Acetobacteraceae bacterium]